MKALSQHILEKLKIRHPVYYELGLDLFNNVKSEEDFNNNANELLNTLLDISENIYDNIKTSVAQDSSDKYIIIVKDKSLIVFVGDNSKDKCFLVLYNTEHGRIMTIKLTGRITKFIPTDHNQSNIYLFKLDNALDDLLNYCEKNAD